MQRECNENATWERKAVAAADEALNRMSIAAERPPRLTKDARGAPAASEQNEAAAADGSRGKESDDAGAPERLTQEARGGTAAERTNQADS